MYNLHYYSCGLSTATIEYSCPSVCLGVRCLCLRELHCGVICKYTEALRGFCDSVGQPHNVMDSKWYKSTFWVFLDMVTPQCFVCCLCHFCLS